MKYYEVVDTIKKNEKYKRFKRTTSAIVSHRDFQVLPAKFYFKVAHAIIRETVRATDRNGVSAGTLVKSWTDTFSFIIYVTYPALTVI